jgi:hypothetical protein
VVEVAVEAILSALLEVWVELRVVFLEVVMEVLSKEMLLPLYRTRVLVVVAVAERVV